MIQVLQSQTVLILEPVNLEEDDTIFGTTIDTRAATAQRHCIRLLHIQRMFLLHPRLAGGAIKCKLFVLTMKGAAMT